MPASPGPQRAADNRLHRAGTVLRGMLDGVTLALNVCGTLLILAIMVLVNADVVGRSFFDTPISGVPELVSMSIVAIVFLQVAQTFRMQRLTRTQAVLALVRKSGQKNRAFAEIVFLAGALAVMGILFLASYPLFQKSWARETYVGTIGDFTAPVWPVKLIILIGCAALFLQLAANLVVAVNSLLTGSDLEETNAQGQVDGEL